MFDTVEKLKETLEKIWAQVKAFIAKLVAGIKKFWGKVTMLQTRTKKRAEALKKAAGELKGDVKEPELEVGKAIRHTMADGKEVVQFGMGTPVDRSSSATKYYTRGVVVPGLKVHTHTHTHTRRHILFGTQHANQNRHMSGW